MGIRDMKRACTLLAAGIMVSAPAWASTEPSPGERREPPQAAFDACKGKSEGAAVEIVIPSGGTIKATCKEFKDQLVAVPEGVSPPPAKN